MNEQQPEPMDLPTARHKVALVAGGLAYQFGPVEALRLLLNQTIGFALACLPRADVSAFLRDTADQVDALRAPPG